MQNRVADLVGSQLFVDIDQGRKLRRRSAAIIAMADAALVLVKSNAARVGGLILDETTEPGHLIRVDVNDACLRIHRRTAPLGTAVETGKNDRRLIDGWWNKLTAAAELLELPHRPGMCLRCSVGE